MSEDKKFCYLLKPLPEFASSRNDKYIGYTVNLVNRMLQHHGYLSGGAPKPCRKWKGNFYLVAYVYGFNTKEEAEQMEWQLKTWRRLRWHRNIELKLNPMHFDGLQRFVRGLWCPKLRHLNLTIHLTEPFRSLPVLEWLEAHLPKNVKTSQEMYQIELN
jgi:predicted GIY-YIG superfamily endonuclease